MTQTLAVLLPIAIGFAISPIPIIELILVLVSKRRVVNTLAFVVTLVIGALGAQAAGSEASGSSMVTTIIIAALGLLLLAIGVQNWRNRADHSAPKVLSTIQAMGPLPVAVLAIGIALFNPKNLPLLLTAGQTVAETESPLLWGIGFVVVASAPYLLVAAYALLGGKPAQDRLDRMRVWLVSRNRFIMGVLCTVLGILMVAKALAGIGG